jgi:hypothetical protein
VYTPRKENGRVDALSCRLDIARIKEITNNTILKVNNNRLLGPTYEVNALLKIRNNILGELQNAIIS